MAAITHLASGASHELSSSTRVGRTPSCPICLENPKVSGEHAAFRWTGSSWELKDLGSRNGTFVDDRRLESGESSLVKLGTRLAFGDTRDVFEVTDDGPPPARARSNDGVIRVAEDGLLTLPDSESPELSVYQDGPWFLEDIRGVRRPIKSGAVVESGGWQWKLELPVVVAQTLPAERETLLLGDLGLRLVVSPAEDHVNVTVLRGDDKLPLQPRAHNQLLVVLANARIRDRGDDELPDEEHGWMYFEQILEQMGTSEGQINVAIFRARKQFAKLNIADATGLIERRTASRQVRLGIADVEVEYL